jgi:tryptophan synthase alpha chain
VNLEPALRAARDRGRRLLAPYVTGGLGKDWLDVVRACSAAGADAIEIGLPFSDPIMDGVTIQEASQRALDLGATPESVIAQAATLDVDTPLVVMTYYNLVARFGHERFASALAAAGIDGAIIADLPLDELELVGWGDTADEHGIECVLLASPTTTDERLAAICERARGFVYGVSLLGVTGERAGLAATAGAMGARLKRATDKPALLGVGISTAEQAAEAARHADGVVVGSALVRRLLQSGGPDEAHEFVACLRAALDTA